MLKRVFLLLLFLLAIAGTAEAQVTGRAVITTSATSGASTNLIGSGIYYHQISWWVTGTVSSCSVKLEKSTDNSTWTDLIAGASCTSNGGPSTLTTGVVNYVRVNATTFSGSGTLTVRYNGYVQQPGGGGFSSAITGTPAANYVTYWSAAATVTGDAGFQYNGTSTAPYITINETDGGTNEKRWRCGVEAKSFTCDTRTDADGAGITFLEVDRGTGTAISSTYLMQASGNFFKIQSSNTAGIRLGGTDMFAFTTTTQTMNGSAFILQNVGATAGMRLQTGLPTISSGFGTSPSITAGSTDTAGEINVGTGGTATTGVIAFQATWTAAPFCVVNDISTGGLAMTSSTSTTQLTLNAPVTPWTASDKIRWVCIGAK